MKAVLIGLVGLVVVLAGCGGTKPDPGPHSYGRVEFRVVAASGKAPAMGPGDAYSAVPDDVASRFAAGVTCTATTPSVAVDTEEAMIACLPDKVPYLLGKRQFVATVKSARPATVGAGWGVDITLHQYAAKQLGDLTKALAGSDRQLAVVADHRLIIAATVTGPIMDGKLQISGSFTQKKAAALAHSLTR